MKQRCDYPGYDRFEDYGGRGISYCDRWSDFSNFLDDMGDRPPGTTLDRIDFDGPYCPENCQWATYKEQSRNRRNAHLLSHNGETKTVTEWAETTGLHRKTIISRIERNGWPVDKALQTPARLLQKRERVISYKGESLPLAVWADRVGMNWRTLWARLYRQKLSIREALTKPIQGRRHDT